jgi:hypothetical protein
MNDKLKELLEKYNAELFKMGVHSKQHEDYCGQVGCKGLEDEKAQLEHTVWMVQQLLDDSEDWSDRKVNRWLGFIQGILWCTKFRGILELRDESRNLYDG